MADWKVRPPFSHCVLCDLCEIHFFSSSPFVPLCLCAFVPSRLGEIPLSPLHRFNSVITAFPISRVDTGSSVKAISAVRCPDFTAA